MTSTRKPYTHVRVLLAALVVVALTITPMAGSPAPIAAAQEARTFRDVTFCTPGSVALKMDIFLPATNGTKLPVVLYLHGGSWVTGDKYEVGLAAGQLTARGYAVASANYRLAPQHKWPAQIEDAKCAVRFLRASATRYGLDTERIGVWGSSAGGQLAALLALTGPNSGFEGKGGYADQSSAVHAVVDMFGPADLTAYKADEYTLEVGRSVFGVTPGQEADILIKASPVTYISRNAPPFLILQGDKDDIVPPEQSQMLHNALTAAGAQSQLVMVKNAGHAFIPVGGNISPGIAEIRSMILDFFDRTLKGGAVTSRLFPETGQVVRGRFLSYWQANGGLAQQGYPLTGEIQERSEVDGKTYTVQYFERAVMEYHPENAAPNDVLLTLLGSIRFRQKYSAEAPGQTPNTSPGSVLFPQTGRRLGGRFLEYWRANGGLAQQGYPISDEFSEVSEADGKTYVVQYFERAVFEYHPENKPPYDVLLSLLGKARLQQKSKP